MDVPQRYWRFPTSEAIDSLAARFGLPTGPHMQDWEIQVADAARLPEFLAAFEGDDLTDGERFTLGEILMQCFEDVAKDGQDLVTTSEWNRFTSLLRASPALHAFSLCYWSSIGSVGRRWDVSPLVRPLWDELELKILADRPP